MKTETSAEHHCVFQSLTCDQFEHKMIGLLVHDLESDLFLPLETIKPRACATAHKDKYRDQDELNPYEVLHEAATFDLVPTIYELLLVGFFGEKFAAYGLADFRESPQYTQEEMEKVTTHDGCCE